MHLLRLTCSAVAGVVLTVSTVSAQTASSGNAHVAPMRAGIGPKMPSAQRDSVPRLNAALEPHYSSRKHHILKGAAIGAVSLAIPGMFAFSQVVVGCDVSSGSSCHPGLGRLALTGYGAALGAMFGGIAGGAIGAIWPVHHNTTPAAR